MADSRRRQDDWQGRGQDPGRDVGRRADSEQGRGRSRGMDRGSREESRDRGRFGGGSDMDRAGRGRGGGLSDREMGRYGRGTEYGGDEDRGRFDQDSREEYRRGGLMRGTPGHRRAGGPGEEFGEGFWSEVTEERTRGDFNRYGDRATLRTQPYDTDRWDRGVYGLGASGSREDHDRYGWGRGWSQDQGRGPYGYGTHRDELPESSPRVRSSYTETDRPRTGYATSPTRDMDRDMGHGAGRGGMQGAYPYYEQSPELPRRERQRGRGPRNYQRSDDRIREDICERLMRTWMDAEDVDIKVDKGEVTLSGTVRSRDEKRAIEDLCEEVLGVKEVHNEIRVAREQPRQDENRESRQGGQTLHS